MQNINLIDATIDEWFISLVFISSVHPWTYKVQNLQLNIKFSLDPHKLHLVHMLKFAAYLQLQAEQQEEVANVLWQYVLTKSHRLAALHSKVITCGTSVGNPFALNIGAGARIGKIPILSHTTYKQNCNSSWLDQLQSLEQFFFQAHSNLQPCRACNLGE